MTATDATERKVELVRRTYQDAIHRMHDDLGYVLADAVCPGKDRDSLAEKFAEALADVGWLP